MPRYDDTHFSPAAPVAKVTLRVPESNAALTEVPMLIDSGADVTLLPQASVDSLGVEANADEVYELVGFDAVSVSRKPCVWIWYSVVKHSRAGSCSSIKRGAF